MLEEYQETITLASDFTDGTLKGCIGCVGDLLTQRAHFGVFLGDDASDVQVVAQDYELHLSTAIIREDGTFERDRVTVSYRERIVTKSEDFWGGALSSRQDTDRNPGWRRASILSISRRATALRACSSDHSWF